MPKRLLFLDTNVFLHCIFFDQLDWRKCAPGDDVTIAVCPQVIHELDDLKFSNRSSRVKNRARQVVKRIWEIAKDDQPVQLREGCWFWQTCREPLMDFAVAGLSKDVGDDVILASALEQRDAGEDVIIVAADIGILAKARSRRLAAMRVPDEWLLPYEPDETERQNKALQREIAELKSASPELHLSFKGEPFGEFSVRRRAPLTSQEIAKTLNELRANRKPMQREHEFGIPMPEELTNHAAADRYNKALKEYFVKMESYLGKMPEASERRDRTIAVALSLENKGTQSAEDVDVVVTAEGDGRWLEERPPADIKKPMPPTMRSPWDAFRMNSPYIPSIHPPPRANAIGRSLNATTPTVVRFHVNLVKPGLPVNLPTRFFEFSSFESAGSFSLSYTLIAKNLRGPTVGTIHVKVQM